MSSENWHEERDRLVELLQAIESGKITHVDQEHLSQLQATNPENVQMLRERLAELNARLADNQAYKPSLAQAALSGPRDIQVGPLRGARTLMHLIDGARARDSRRGRGQTR
jgi:hypothetical protein